MNSGDGLLCRRCCRCDKTFLFELGVLYRLKQPYLIALKTSVTARRASASRVLPIAFALMRGTDGVSLQQYELHRSHNLRKLLHWAQCCIPQCMQGGGWLNGCNSRGYKAMSLLDFSHEACYVAYSNTRDDVSSTSATALPCCSCSGKQRLFAVPIR